MFRIDDSQSPLVVIHFDGPMTLDETHRMLAYFNQLLDTGAPFALAMASNNEAQHEKGVAKAQKQWLQANRSRIGKTCVGIAMVTQSSKFIALYKPIANQIIQRMYHCPGRLFTDLEEATTWLRYQLRQAASFSSGTR
jgi:hypothetical protein